MAWLELLLGLVPVTVAWVLFFPGIVNVLFDSPSRDAQALVLPVLFGGLAGLPTLWSLVLPPARGRPGRRLGAWRLLGLALLLYATATWLIWIFDQSGPLDVRRFDAREWLAFGAPCSAVAVSVIELIVAARVARAARRPLSPPAPTRSGST